MQDVNEAKGVLYDHGHQSVIEVLTVEGRGLGFAVAGGSSCWLDVMPCQNLPKEASRLTGAVCDAAVLGFAFMTSSAVGGGGAAPKEEWGLPASMAGVYTQHLHVLCNWGVCTSAPM